MADVVNSINSRYVSISNRMTSAYERVYGLPCDLYFPVFKADRYNRYTKYRDMKIFDPHQSFTYRDKPDVSGTRFYIPYLIKKDAMNSSELEFDSFYSEQESLDRPFIETSKKRELYVGTKVVVYQGNSISKFFVDKKLVVTGADGFMLLRMYLAPLAKDNDGDTTAEEQEESISKIDEENPPECDCECDDCECNENNDNNGLGMGLGASLGSSLQMNIPDDDEDWTNG